MSVTVSAKHRQAVLVQPGTVEVREVPVPRPGPGQVLLRIDRALAGGTDLKAFQRGHPQVPMPGPFGHRYAGTVAALGRDAPPFAVGQPVMGVHSAPCLHCDLCRKGRQHLCPEVMREKVLGAFGQFLCVPAPVARQNLFPRPDGLDAERAALLEPLACVVHGLERLDWRGIDRVLVLGLGALGLLFLQLLPHYSRAAVVATGRRAARLALARRLGTATVVEELPAGEQFDCVIECTGKVEGWQEGFDRTAPGGEVLLFSGLPRGTVFPVDSFRAHYEEVRIVGAFHFAPHDVARAREFLLGGAVRPEGLVSGTVDLDGLAHALHRLGEGDGIQYAIDPWA